MEEKTMVESKDIMELLEIAEARAKSLLYYSSHYAELPNNDNIYLRNALSKIQEAVSSLIQYGYKPSDSASRSKF